jgi:hypothetical protein
MDVLSVRQGVLGVVLKTKEETMKRETLRKFAIVMSLLIACALMVPSAMADTISATCVANTCTVSGTNSNGLTVNATAAFSFSANTVTVTLTNNLTNAQMEAVNQAITGLYFTLSGGQIGGTASSTATFTNIASNGTATTAGSGAAGWILESFSGFNHLCLICNGPNPTAPEHAIIGGTGTGTYANAGGSIAGNDPHNPFIYGATTFTLTIQGVTSNTQLGQVFIQFNTDLTSPTPPPPVPEPTSMALLGTGLVSLAGAIRRKLRS